MTFCSPTRSRRPCFTQRVLGPLAVMFLLGASSPLLVAQDPAMTSKTLTLDVPAVRIAGPPTPGIPHSASEAAYQVLVRGLRAGEATPSLTERYPEDSIRQVVATEAAEWLKRLQSTPVRGIQLDSYGRVAISAGQDSLARQQFAARLATPGLSTQEKAYTYLTAIMAFTNTMDVKRLAIAEQYLASLDALGSDAAYWQHTAHRQLVNAYYSMTQMDDVARHGLRAAALMEKLDYIDRGVVFAPKLGSRTYAQIIDALSRRSDGRAKINAYNAMLKSAARATPAILAMDRDFEWRQRGYEEGLNTMMGLSSRVGTRAQDIIANYWMNMPTTDSQTVSVSDGRVRVLDISNYTCSGCLGTLHELQRLQDRFPDVQVIGTAWTTGSWGNRLVEADVEVANLRPTYIDRLKLTFPIAVWKGTKDVNDDGGITPADMGGPNLKNYPLSGNSNIYVIDGQGIIRGVYGGFSREDEVSMSQLLIVLLRESRENKNRTAQSTSTTH